MTNSHPVLKRPQKPTAVTQEVITLNGDQKKAPAVEPDLQPQQQQQELEPEAQLAPQTEKEQSQYSKRPSFSKPKPLTSLESVTGASGDLFHPGDKITVSAPWGDRATAEIVKLYQDDSGNAWVKYSPLESRDGWTWEGGFIRAALVVKA